MDRTTGDSYLIKASDLILVTGATGFIGSRLVRHLLDLGFRNIRCFVRPSSNAAPVNRPEGVKPDQTHVEIFRGNLLSQEDCIAATKDVVLIFHLAAGRGEKSFPDAFMNSVVTTRNLLEGTMQHQCLRRFVNVSSFAVYSNREKPHGRLLDESCPVEAHPQTRGEAYCFAKVNQDAIVEGYSRRAGIPCVTVRPGYVFGPGKPAITGRVGISTFGIFLHLGGANTIPFTYVDNCADAIALAGLKPGMDGHVFNVVDDELPSSRQFLRLYKRNVKRFASFYVPHAVSYVLCHWWEMYSRWSEDQLPPVFNTGRWHANWKRTQYSNAKLKTMLGWEPKVSMEEGLKRFFASCRDRGEHA